MATAPGNSINETTTGISGFTGTSFVGTPVTQYNVLTGGATSSTLNNVAPSATSGVPLISQGSSSQPIFGTAVVAGGGTGITSTTAYGVLCGGTTTTGALQNAGAGTAGQFLLSNGSSSLPSFASNSGSSTWTPSLKFGGNSTGMTYTTQTGSYVRIGNMIYVNFQIVLSNKGSSTGNATITGLPFVTDSNAVNYMSVLAIDTITLTAGWVYAMVRGTTSASSLDLVMSGNSGQIFAFMTNSVFANTSAISGSLWYYTP